MPKSDVEYKSGEDVVRGEVLYHDDGNKHPGLLLIHGLQSSREELGNLPQKMFIDGYTCMIVDIRGHGKSDGMRGFVSKEIWTEDVKLAFDILESHPEVDSNRLGMAGHSLGGATTIISAALDKRIKCAVAIAPPGTIREQLSGGARFMFSILYAFGRLKVALGGKPLYIKNPNTYEMLYFDKSAPDKARRLGFLQSTTPVANYKTLMDFNAIEYAGKVKVPTLIIIGDKDRVVKPSSSMALYKAIAGEKKCIVVNDSGHSMMYDQKSDEVINHTLQWFNKWLKKAVPLEEEEELDESETIETTM